MKAVVASLCVAKVMIYCRQSDNDWVPTSSVMALLLS